MEARRSWFWKFLFLWGLALLAMQAPDAAWSQGGGASIIQSYAKPLPLPDFSLEDLQGKPTFMKEFRGKVLLLHFWATW